MDKEALVHRRKKRYMAKVLEAFERDIEPHVPADAANKFKGIVRQKLHALALDACEVISLKPGEELNGEVIDLRDQLQDDDSRPSKRSIRA